MTFDATHTRESELREILAQECDARGFSFASQAMRNAPEETHWTGVALAAMRRISTPIPLTPSDEMVAAAQKAWELNAISFEDEDAMRHAIQAALNLMGGKK